MLFSLVFSHKKERRSAEEQNAFGSIKPEADLSVLQNKLCLETLAVL